MKKDKRSPLRKRQDGRRIEKRLRRQAKRDALKREARRVGYLGTGSSEPSNFISALLGLGPRNGKRGRS